MKLKRLRILGLSLLLGYTGLAQADLDNQKFELNTDDLTEFHLYNMNGNVEVIGVDGNKASVEIERLPDTCYKNRQAEADTMRKSFEPVYSSNV